MGDFNKNKLWVGIGRCGSFTEGDCHIFRVWPNDPVWEKNKSRDLMPKFIDAKSLEDARSQAHWFIDKMFNEWVKFDTPDAIVPAQVSAPSQPWTPPPSGIEGLESLSIEGAGTEEVKQSNGDLLNLGDLLK